MWIIIELNIDSCSLEQSPVDGFDGELKSSSSGSDEENSETPHKKDSANQKKPVCLT